MFRLHQVARNEAVVQLLRVVTGAQDIHLELQMRIFSKEFQNGDEIFYGTVVAQIEVYVTSDPWLKITNAPRINFTTTAPPLMVTDELN